MTSMLSNYLIILYILLGIVLLLLLFYILIHNTGIIIWNQCFMTIIFNIRTNQIMNKIYNSRLLNMKLVIIKL